MPEHICTRCRRQRAKKGREGVGGESSCLPFDAELMMLGFRVKMYGYMIYGNLMLHVCFM